MLNLIVVIVGIVWANHFLKKREERDKVAKILSEEYEYLEKHDDIPGQVFKIRHDLKKILIFNGKRNQRVNGFDLLGYMCRNGKCTSIFEEEANGETLQENVRKIWKLFRSFRINLTLERKCSECVKKELGPLVTDLARTIAPLVTKPRRETISAVLKYFGEPPLKPTPEILTPTLPAYVEGARIGGSHESSWVITYDDTIWVSVNAQETKEVQQIREDLTKVRDGLKEKNLPRLEPQVRRLEENCLSDDDRSTVDWDQTEDRRINMLYVVRRVLHSQANLRKASVMNPKFEIPEGTSASTFSTRILRQRLQRITGDIEQHFTCLKSDVGLANDEIVKLLEETDQKLLEHIRAFHSVKTAGLRHPRSPPGPAPVIRSHKVTVV